MKAHVTYNLLDESGEPVSSWHTRNKLVEYHDKGSLGYSQFISKEILENSGLLLVAADRYNMDRLKLMREDRLCRSIDVGSVVNILALAKQYCCHDLRKTCMRSLEYPEAGKAVLTMQTDDFEALCQNFPSVHKELFFHKLSK